MPTTDNQSIPAAVAEVRRQLAAAARSGMLMRLDPCEQSDLLADALGVVAVFDDSVSNHHLGSMFDRQNSSPINRTLAAVQDAYGAAHTFLSTSGTSALNAAAVASLAGPGEEIIVDRGCHRSVMAGLIHGGARPCWLVPPYDAEAGVLLPLSVAEVEAALHNHPAAKAVVLTRPTYEGLVADLLPIVAACRQRGVALMVDEAHGPHFHFLQDLGFPLDGVSAGADLVTHSTHKVLSALNQGSLLHVRDSRLAERYEATQGLGFQSTSFSYPILASVEHAVLQMVEEGEWQWRRAIADAARLRSGLARLPGLDLLSPTRFDTARVSGADPTRVTVNVRGLGLFGWQVADLLAMRGVDVEMASLDTVLFLIGPAHSATVDAILAGFDAVVAERTTPRPSRPVSIPAPWVIVPPREAFYAKRRRRVSRDAAVGHVAAEMIGAYPPGRIVIGPGERVTAKAVACLEEIVAAGGHILRARDDGFRTIEIVETLWVA